MLKIKKAEINDINNIIKLKDKIWCDLENKNWYFVEELTYEKLKEIIEKRGFILKTIVTDELVGYLIAVTNLHKNFELINLINKKINLKECAEISLAVEVNNRNKGIASEMLKTAEKYLTDKKYVIVTIHQDNEASLKTFFNANYQIQKKVKIYNNKERFILLKKINEESD